MITFSTIETKYIASEITTQSMMNGLEKVLHSLELIILYIHKIETTDYLKDFKFEGMNKHTKRLNNSS